MNEEEAVQRMRDLESSIETSMKYGRAWEKLPAVFLMFLAGVLLSILILVASDIYDYYIVYTELGYIPVPIAPDLSVSVGIPVFFLWMLLAYLIYRIIYRAFSRSSAGRWGKYLDEGVTGILRVLESEDWTDTVNRLRKAKQGFLVISALQFIAYWAFAFFVLLVSYSVISAFLSGVSLNSLNLYLIAFVSVAVVVGLGDRSIRKSYNELWYMDGLIAELRWFYLEFQGSGL